MSKTFKGFRPRSKLEQFTAIPNELFDRVMKELNGNELKILLTIFRNTYGWVKKIENGNAIYKIKEEISMSVFKEKTGMSSNTIRKYLKQLLEKGYIEKHYDHDAKIQRAACYSIRQASNKLSPPSNSEGGKNNEPPSNSEGAPPQGLNPSKKRSKEIIEEDEERKLSTDEKQLFKNIFQRKISPFEEKKLFEIERKNHLIKKALKITGLNSKNKTLNYTISLLRDWQQKGIKSVEEVEEMIEKYKKGSKKNYVAKMNNYIDPTDGMSEEEERKYYKEKGYR